MDFPWLVDGSGRPPWMVFLPGLLGDEHSFRRVTALLAEHGMTSIRTAYPWRPFTLHAYAHDLLARLPHDPVVVVGTSMGGYLAQLLASLAPARVQGLVLVNTFASVAEVMGRVRWVLRAPWLPGGWLKNRLRKGLTPAHFGHDPVVQAQVLDVLERLPARALRARLRALALQDTLPPHPERVPAVVCFTQGDPTVADAQRRALLERVHPLYVYEFSAGGHFPYLAQPARFHDVLLTAHQHLTGAAR